MKQLKYRYAFMLLLPFGYGMELVNLNKVKLGEETPTLKTREERSPHYPSVSFPGFFNSPFGWNHGSHEHKHGLECPFPYKRVGERCYYAKCTNVATDELYWEDARSYCQTTIRGGGDLAIFDNANEYADAVRYLSSLDPANLNTCDYWIGGYDNDTIDNYWMWINGQPMPLGIPFWGYAYDLTPSIIGLLPVSSTTDHEAYLSEGNNYFIHQADGSAVTLFPLCQTSLERADQGHHYHGHHGGSSHEEHHFGSFHHSEPHWRSGQQDSFPSQLRQINPFQNSPLRSSQFAPPNNHYTGSYSNNPHRMPNVMNSQQRNFPIPEMFNERNAISNSSTLQSIVGSDDSAKNTTPESKDPYLEKILEEINPEIMVPGGKEVKTILQQLDNHESDNGQQVDEGFMQELAKHSTTEIKDNKKEVNPKDDHIELRIPADDPVKESETNLEVNVPATSIQGVLSDINLSIHDQNEKLTDEDDVVNIPVNEQDDKFINKEEDIDKLLMNHKGLSAGMKDDLSKQEITFNNNLAFEHEGDLIQPEASIPFDEFTKIEAQKEIQTGKAKIEFDIEQVTSEGKRNEFQPDGLTSHLPGMIYDMGKISQNMMELINQDLTLTAPRSLNHECQQC